MAANKLMQIYLNQAPLEVAEHWTLGDLAASLPKHGDGIAFAIDEQVVVRSLWSQTRLSEQLRISAFRAIAGG